MTTLQKTSLLILAIVLLAAIGISIDLTYIHFKVNTLTENYQSFCNINSEMNCDAVALSAWSTLFGIPISILGAITYLASLILVVIQFTKLKSLIKNAPEYLQLTAIGSVLYSCFLAWICFSELGTWCIMCIALYSANLLFLIFSITASPTPLKNLISAIKEDSAWVFSKGSRIAIVATLVIIVFAVFATSNYFETKAEQKKIQSVGKKLRLLPKPVDLTGNIIGVDQAPVSIVVFSDYQCPFCSKIDLQLEEIVDGNPLVRIVRKDFPLDQACNPAVNRPFHKHACDAAYYANCALEFGKYREFHDHLVNNFNRISPDFLVKSVAKFGFDKEKFNACVKSPRIKNKLLKMMKQGIETNIPGTPAIILDGKEIITGGVSKEELAEMIRLKIKSKGKAILEN